MSTSVTSPGRSQRGGVRAIPTPCGVPVAITSPALEGHHRTQLGDKSGDVEDHVPVLALWSVSPLTPATDAQIVRVGDLVGGYQAGPIGEKVSKFLPRVHWEVRIW